MTRFDQAMLGFTYFMGVVCGFFFLDHWWQILISAGIYALLSELMIMKNQ